MSGCACSCHSAVPPKGAQWYCDVCRLTTFALEIGGVTPSSTYPVKHDDMIYRGALVEAAREKTHDSALKDGHVPYPAFCMHPARCDGLSSCPRDHSCVD